jgi:hypothetical protein
VCGAFAVGLVGAGFGRAGAVGVSPASTHSTSSGSHLVTISKAGFSLEVPDTWLALDPKSKLFPEIMRRAEAANPRLVPLLKQAASGFGSAVLWAVDQTASRFTSNLAVNPLPIDKSELNDAAGFQAAFKAEAPQIADVQARKTAVAGVAALVATGTLQENSLDGTPVTAHVTVYVVPSRSGVLEFNFATPDDGEQDPTVQAMINSLTLVGFTPAVSGQTPPSRYVSGICAAMNTWDDKTNGDVSGPLTDLNANKGSMSSARARVTSLYAAETKATDVLIAAANTKGAPRMPNGDAIAKSYLQILNGAHTAFSTAQHAAASAPITSPAVLTSAVHKIDDKLTNTLSSLGDPLAAMYKSPSLVTLIESDAGCANVLDTYRSALTSGLIVGDCTTNNETKIACTQPHTDEVTLVTSYPGGLTTPWPGNDTMDAFATPACNAAFTTYVGIAVDQSKNVMGYFSPNPGGDWNSGDREIVCTVENAHDTPQTGTLKGAAS